MGILGGLLKVIISPITMVFGQVLYGALIKFPLEILNFLNSAFLFLSGSGVDKILFNTSFSNGGIKMNFFSNTSPIQHFYLITFAVAGGLGAIFLVVAVIKTITSQKTGSTHGAITAAGRITGGMFLLTLIPVVVLGFLSMKLRQKNLNVKKLLF